VSATSSSAIALDSRYSTISKSRTNINSAMSEQLAMHKSGSGLNIEKIQSSQSIVVFRYREEVSISYVEGGHNRRGSLDPSTTRSRKYPH
jgi:hypothetical protein